MHANNKSNLKRTETYVNENPTKEESCIVSEENTATSDRTLSEEIILSKESVSSMEDVYKLFSEALNFPEYFGNNLDSLYDCLSEENKTTVIVIKDEDFLCETIDQFKVLLDLLITVSKENNEIILKTEDN